MLTFIYPHKKKQEKQCKITQTSATEIVIEENGSQYHFSEVDKPTFANERGEAVTEYSGLATDGTTKCSWAIARFNPLGTSTAHIHKERKEYYYILSGQAKVILDGQECFLSAGDKIKIRPGQQHQVINTSADQKLELVVKCEPAWHISDFHVVTENADQPAKSGPKI